MNNKVDISFVNMPMIVLHQPSISLGLLKAVLGKEGISSRVFYGNLLFTEEVFIVFIKSFIKEFEKIQENFDDNTLTNNLIFKLLSKWERKFLGDWLFVPLIFNEYKDNTDWYIDYLFKDINFFRNIKKDTVKDLLLDTCIKSQEFIINLAKEILGYNPEIVGCTCLMSQYIPSLALLKVIKDMAPEVTTMMGGSHFEKITGPETHKLFPWIDYIVLGEADEIITSLVNSILHNGKNMAKEKLPSSIITPYHRAKGYSDNYFLFQTGENYLESLSPPDYDDYFEILDGLPNVKEALNVVLPFEGSRGCWWGKECPCTFCGVDGLKPGYRKKSVRTVLKELEFLHNRYKINHLVSVDSAMDMSYFTTFLPELVRLGKPYKIYYTVRANLTRAQIELLSKAGIKGILPGIETFHSEILKLMNKGTKAWQNIHLLKWCLFYGIDVQWNFLHSVPDEEDVWYEEMAEAIPLLVHLRPPTSILPVLFERYSLYYKKPQEYGLTLFPADFYSHILPLSGQVLTNLAFYFTDEGRSEREEDEMYDLFHIGFLSLKRELIKWKEFFRLKRPVLNMIITDDKLEISDSRPCAVKPSFLLSGFLRDLYLACDEAPMKDEVIKTFKDKNIEEDEIISSIGKFLEWKLMIEIDNRLLSLAVREIISKDNYEQ